MEQRRTLLKKMEGDPAKKGLYNIAASYAEKETLHDFMTTK
jgi:hypothetical protein